MNSALPSPHTFAVRQKHDIPPLRRAARAFARSLDFSEVREYELAIAVSELAENLIHHAPRGGIFTLRIIQGSKGQGVEVRCVDEGPGIVDITQALQDGYSSIGSLGGGLGAVQRFTDEFHIESPPGAGLTVILRKYP